MLLMHHAATVQCKPASESSGTGQKWILKAIQICSLTSQVALHGAFVE
jgi:hypothetical protein